MYMTLSELRTHLNDLETELQLTIAHGHVNDHNAVVEEMEQVIKAIEYLEKKQKSSLAAA